MNSPSPTHSSTNRPDPAPMSPYPRNCRQRFRSRLDLLPTCPTRRFYGHVKRTESIEQLVGQCTSGKGREGGDSLGTRTHWASAPPFTLSTRIAPAVRTCSPEASGFGRLPSELPYPSLAARPAALQPSSGQRTAVPSVPARAECPARRH